LSCLGLAVLAGLAIGCNTSHHAGKVPRESPITQAQPPAAQPRPLPPGTAEGVPEHLLQEYADREPATEAEMRTWQLPYQAKRIAVALMILAARDDMTGLRNLFTVDARWGLPDRREYDARPIIGDDGGREFFDIFREVATRFSRKEAFFCPPILPPIAQLYVRNGAEPMWCAYLSRDGLDILAFKFVYEGGSAKIGYIGMLPVRPTEGLRPRRGPAPPPMTPQIKRGTSPPAPFLQIDQNDGTTTTPLTIVPRETPPGTPPPGAIQLSPSAPGTPPPGVPTAPIGTPPAAPTTPVGTPPAAPAPAKAP
jgi:hypothetical protein